MSPRVLGVLIIVAGLVAGIAGEIRSRDQAAARPASTAR